TNSKPAARRRVTSAATSETWRQTWWIPSPLLSRNLAIAEAGLVGSRSSKRLSPTWKKRTFTCSVGTSSPPPGFAPRRSSKRFDAASRSRTAIPRWSILLALTGLSGALGGLGPQVSRALVRGVLAAAEIEALPVVALLELALHFAVELAQD